jgi:hypothetical protein
MEDLKKIVKEKYGQIARESKFKLDTGVVVPAPGCCSGLITPFSAKAMKTLKATILMPTWALAADCPQNLQ